MSGVNIACNIGNKMGHGGGEMKFDVTSKDSASMATCIAADIVNDILENALDIATMGDVTAMNCDTIAFSVDDGVCNLLSKSQMDEVQDEGSEHCAQIRDIIEGLSVLHVPNQNAEEPVRLDIEMKRLINEMMSPPYNIVNYETIPRKDGVGDQPTVDEVKDEDQISISSEECLVDAEKIKVVEKKTRLTDLVMSSKQVLNEYLMSEENRKRQAEWEETNEQVLQVIELDCVRPEETAALTHKKVDECSESIEFTPVAREEGLVCVDLHSTPKENIPNEQKAGGENYTDEKTSSLAGSSCSTGSPSDEITNQKIRTKLENIRKKKWNINLKFWGFGKRKQKGKQEKGTL